MPSYNDPEVIKGKDEVTKLLSNNSTGKPLAIRISPSTQGGAKAIRNILDAQLRKSRRNDTNYAGEANQVERSIDKAVTSYDNIIPDYEYKIFNNFVDKEDEDWLTSKLVMKYLGAKMSEKLSYTLGHLSYKNPNHIINSDFIKELRFDGYDDGSKDEFEGQEKHYWFCMGLSLGESMVINPPFQFHANDDARTHVRYMKLGRIYAETIYGHMTVMSIMPGSIKYHTGLLKLIGFDGGMGSATAAYIRSGGGGLKAKLAGAWMAVGDFFGVVGAIGSVIFGGSKIIEFMDRYPLYKQYANGLIQAIATNLGLIDILGTYPGKYPVLSLDHILPGINLKRVAGWKGWRANHILNFRIGNDVGVSESFSNSTTSNPIMDSMNSEGTEDEASRQTGDISKAGAVATGFMQFLNGNASQGAITFAGAFGNRMMAKGSQMMGIKAGIFKGTMPEIWESSSFSRSYSFNFTFHSPYGDAQSIFENTYLPTLLLLALALPRQIGGFTYIEPFAIRIIIPGLLNINFGIIESLSIERGEQTNDWTDREIPKTIKVSMNVKDVDQIITMPLASKSLFKSIFPNLFPSSGLSEYLVTMSGISLAEQIDWRHGMGRNFKRWAAGLRGRTNFNALEASVAGWGWFRNLNHFLFGSIGTDDISGNRDNIDDLNDKYVKDGRVWNRKGQTLISRWLAKVYTKGSDDNINVEYLGRDRFGVDVTDEENK